MRRSSRISKTTDKTQEKKKIQVEDNQKSKKRTKPVARDDPSPAPVKKRKTNSNLSAQSSKQPVKKQPAKKQAVKDTTELKKVIIKGTVPVDPHFPKASQAKVMNYNGINYAATLNQSNIANNYNKFYIVQILQTQTTPVQYYFFTRWGRVGVTGQMANFGPISRQQAIAQYNSKLHDKTKSGEYRIVEMNYQADDKNQSDQKKQQNKSKQPQVKSDLNQKVQDLVKLIFDMKMMNKQMKQIGYDAKKMPLGKLAKSSIMKGYQALKGLMDQVKGKNRKQILQKYSSDFYSYIPHDFGFMKMHLFILDSQKKIKQKLQMLQSLEDIQIFTKILDQGKISSDINQIDSNYLKIGTQILPVDKSSYTYKMLLEYVQNTHAVTHNNYKLQVLEIYSLKKQTENARYTTHIGNKQLLWHGSRLTNYVGILSQGLRIAPPQAPVTGYMFGKGVYFADMVSKSANYCFTNKENNVGLMLLCQVALGDINQKKYADYYANLLPPGKYSTKGVGKCAPQTGVNWEGIYVPNGVGKPTGITDTSLLYNQFIVYDVAQIRSRFLFKMKFHYK